VKRLTLMRHANAEWKDAQISDFDRPLNRRGNSEAQAMGRRLIVLRLKPTVLLTSSAKRAQQTADIIAREMGIAPGNLRSEESLYLAAAADLLRVVRESGPRIPHLMIVGHNPGISEIAQLLAPAPRSEDMGTAGICSITFDARNWAGVCARTFRDSLRESPPAGLFGLWA
jgi:phosphohistidine phosphatase